VTTDDRRPTHAEGVEAHEVDDGLVVYHEATDRVHYLNQTAAVVFELCTGDHTEQQIEALVADAWGLDESPHAEVQACLEQLRAEGVVV
jgi:PqqD family protein of HPr-rel-A system